MAVFSIPGLRLSAVSAALPRQEVRNEDLALLKQSKYDTFAQTVGIYTRRIAPSAICASDLCIAATRYLLDGVGLRPEQVGILIFVTQTPDYPLPGNSMLAQHQLGLPASTFLLDVNQGCAGYVYGLATLACLMNAMQISKGLLLAGDTLSRIVSAQDSSTAPIFSDAGSATLLERAQGAELMYFNLGTEGQGANVIRVAGGGSRLPFGPDSLVMSRESENVVRAPIHLSMRGMDVLHYCSKYVAPSIHELLWFAGASIETPDYYVFHQANHILNDCLVRRLGVPAHKVPETLSEYGNTSCATIPVTMCSRLREELAGGPARLLLAGFGAGFSWGSSLITAQSVLCPAPLEIDRPDGT